MCDFARFAFVMFRMFSLKRSNNLLFIHTVEMRDFFHSAEWFRCFLFVPSRCKSFYGHEREVKKRRVYNVQICSIEWRSDIMDRFYLNTLCFAATSITASKDFVMINDTLKCKYAHRHETGPTKCGWLVRFKFYFCQTENLKKL